MTLQFPTYLKQMQHKSVKNFYAICLPGAAARGMYVGI